MSLEGQLKDLQIHISQNLANSEVRSSALAPIKAGNACSSAIDCTNSYMCDRAHLRPPKLEMHARMQLIAPIVQSSTLGRPGSSKTLKLAYKYHFYSL